MISYQVTRGEDNLMMVFPYDNEVESNIQSLIYPNKLGMC